MRQSAIAVDAFFAGRTDVVDAETRRDRAERSEDPRSGRPDAAFVRIGDMSTFVVHRDVETHDVAADGQSLTISLRSEGDVLLVRTNAVRDLVGSRRSGAQIAGLLRRSILIRSRLAGSSTPATSCASARHTLGASAVSSKSLGVRRIIDRRAARQLEDCPLPMPPMSAQRRIVAQARGASRRSARRQREPAHSAGLQPSPFRSSQRVLRSARPAVSERRAGVSPARTDPGRAGGRRPTKRTRKAKAS